MCRAAQIIGYGIVSIQMVTGAEVAKLGGGLDFFHLTEFTLAACLNCESEGFALINVSLTPTTSTSRFRCSCYYLRFTCFLTNKIIFPNTQSIPEMLKTRADLLIKMLTNTLNSLIDSLCDPRSYVLNWTRIGLDHLHVHEVVRSASAPG